MLYLLLGAIVGIILALTGAGGGILAVPLLVFGAQMRVAQAVPIGLLAVGLAAASGAAAGLRSGTVRYKAALLISATGVLFSPVGLWLAHRVPNRPLSALFAGVLFYVAYRVFQKRGRESRSCRSIAWCAAVSVRHTGRTIDLDRALRPCTDLGRRNRRIYVRSVGGRRGFRHGACVATHHRSER